jgi:hypothetical protein
MIKYILFGPIHIMNAYHIPLDVRSKVVPPYMLQEAKDTLAAFDWVGRTEELGAFQQRIFDALGVPDMHTKHANSHGTQEVDIEINDEDLRIICATVPGDEALYQYVFGEGSTRCSKMLSPIS